jgi:hypothetical protein
LISLQGAPRTVESFYCNSNNLKTLDGAPDEVGLSFNCAENNLVSLVGAPKKVFFDFSCGDNAVQFTVDDVRAVSKVGRDIIVTRS